MVNSNDGPFSKGCLWLLNGNIISFQSYVCRPDCFCAICCKIQHICFTIIFFLDMVSFMPYLYSTNLKGNLSNWCRNFVFVCWPDRTENAKQMNVWFQSFFFLCLKRLFDKQMTRQGVIWKVLHNKLDFTLITNRTYLLRCVHIWTWK